MTEVEKLSQDPQGSEPLEYAVDVRKAVRQQLQSLHWAGLSHLPKGNGEFEFDLSEPADDTPEQTAKPAAAAPEPAIENQEKPPVMQTTAVTPIRSTPNQKPAPAATPAMFNDPYGTSVDLNQRKSALRVLQDEVAGCTKCEELCSSRTQTVFGVGNPTARLVFFGEAPGATEDREGLPFVGEAGQLLDKIMTACKLSRNDVYILNSVKCRPPLNRNPAPDELANCWGYAEQQLEIIQPEFICCLGSVASKTLLKTTESLGRLRRRFHVYRGSRVLVTYHPAYLLRTPSAKRHVWEDMQTADERNGRGFVEIAWCRSPVRGWSKGFLVKLSSIGVVLEDGSIRQNRHFRCST